MVVRWEIATKVHPNKVLLTELKISLKMFIDQTAALEEGLSPQAGRLGGRGSQGWPTSPRSTPGG